MRQRSEKRDPIREAYRRAGMNRSEFQRAIGVAYSTILNWERGLTRPNADHLERIAQATGVALSELLEGVPSERARDHEVHPALRDFLSSAAAQRLTAGERRTLEGVVFYGVEPTVATFHAFLVGLRLGEKLPARRASRARR